MVPASPLYHRLHLFEPSRRVLVQQARDQRLVRQALRQGSLLDRLQVLARQPDVQPSVLAKRCLRVARVTGRARACRPWRTAPSRRHQASSSLFSPRYSFVAFRLGMIASGFSVRPGTSDQGFGTPRLAPPAICPIPRGQPRRAIAKCGGCSIRRPTPRSRPKGVSFSSCIGAWRLVVRLGHAQAIGAIAHRLCRLIWKMRHDGVTHEERGPAVTKHRAQRRAAKMIRELRALGYRVEQVSAPASSPA
jgi:hypothetical protein